MKNNCTIKTANNSITAIFSELYAMGVQSVHTCYCGAITFDFYNGNVSVMPENAGKFFPQISQEHFDELADTLVPEYYNCNHCVNHWGLDLCKCGSGDSVEECSHNSAYCGTPAQTLEEVM